MYFIELVFFSFYSSNLRFKNLSVNTIDPGETVTMTIAYICEYENQ